MTGCILFLMLIIIWRQPMHVQLVRCGKYFCSSFRIRIYYARSNSVEQSWKHEWKLELKSLVPFHYWVLSWHMGLGTKCNVRVSFCCSLFLLHTMNTFSLVSSFRLELGCSHFIHKFKLNSMMQIGKNVQSLKNEQLAEIHEKSF